MGNPLHAGLISGTSLGGINAVLAEFEPEPYLLATQWRPYPEEIKQAIVDLQQPGNDELHRALKLGNQLADLYAEAVQGLLKRAGVAESRVQAIGCHGQTLRHHPELGYSFQLNNPARLAERAGITVVADFCSRDIAAGGQGSPVASAFHGALFRHPDIHRVVVDVGGIAKLTDLPAAGPITGFDCGPGNLLMDAWVKRHWGCDYDPGGTLASQGQVLDNLLQALTTHPFIARPMPKSARREDFAPVWVDSLLHGREAVEDVLATLLEFSVHNIANAVRSRCPGARELWVCGGGAHNDQLLARLRQHLPGVRVAITDALGISVEWVEAYAVAWLAWRNLRGLTGNPPEVSGAAGARILGAIYSA